MGARRPRRQRDGARLTARCEFSGDRLIVQPRADQILDPSRPRIEAKPVSGDALGRLDPLSSLLRNPPVDPIGVVRRFAMRVVSSRIDRSRRVAAELRRGQGAGR
jgi:hypothetical protein